MEIFIAIAIIVSILSIDGKLKKNNANQEEIIALLKEMKNK
ncbi:hypothetical protein [Salipaludibacillus agaradhaerens]|jgi:hypothetical protein|nr:hypothetical protein [Salipaludibacillus agaradhaerens]